jgi:hypothetical protein
MTAKLTRQIVCVGVALWLLWGAWEAYTQVGLALKSGVPAGLSIVFLVLAITAKGG